MPEFSFTDRILTNANGNQQIINFYNYAKRFSNCWLTLNVDNLVYMEANLSALVVAMAHKLRKEKRVRIYLDYKNLKGDLNILVRNGFSSWVTGNQDKFKPFDQRESTIPVCAFPIDAIDDYVEYIERTLMRHRGMDKVKFQDKGRVKDGYLEIFENVDLHANTKEPVFCCGQYFPYLKEVKFTLVDLGDGFLKKIMAFTKNFEYPIEEAVDAIKWAIEGGSTKPDAMGGTGLKRIFMYCLKNNGEIHIVSDDCYWSFFDRKIENQKIDKPFVGATIHLVFRHL